MKTMKVDKSLEEVWDWKSRANTEYAKFFKLEDKEFEKKIRQHSENFKNQYDLKLSSKK